MPKSDQEICKATVLPGIPAYFINALISFSIKLLALAPLTIASDPS